MTQLLNAILTLLITYGYPSAMVGVALGYTGIPLPQDVILLAAGSLTSDGSLSLPLLVFLLTATAVAGDVLAYTVGRKLGIAFVYKHGHRIKLNDTHIQYLEKFLKKWGVLAVFSTRWLITPLGTPISILAGVGKFALFQYVITVILGELLWVCIFTFLGNIFGANWQGLLNYVQNIPEIAFFASIGIALLYFGLKRSQKRA